MTITEQSKLLLFDNFYLTPLNLNDAEDRWKAFNNKNVTKYLASPRKDPFTLEDAKEHISGSLSKYSDSPIPLSWAIRDSTCPNRMIGSMDIHTSDYGIEAYLPNPELKERYATFGFYLIPEYHSKGIVSKALKTIVEKVGHDILGINYFYGGCFVGNIGSRKTFEKCGFKYVKTIKDGAIKYIPYELKDIEIFELVMENNVNR